MPYHSPTSSTSDSPGTSTGRGRRGGRARGAGCQRQLLQPGDLTPGCIVWLESKELLLKSAHSTPTTGAKKGRLEDVECIGTARCACSRDQEDANGGQKKKKQRTAKAILPWIAYHHPAVILQVHQRAGSKVRGDLECVVATVGLCLLLTDPLAHLG